MANPIKLNTIVTTATFDSSLSVSHVGLETASMLEGLDAVSVSTVPLVDGNVN